MLNVLHYSDWGAYNGGIYDGCKYTCNIALNHAVQLVGYGSDSDSDYWIVRNSWGPGWGEDGYIRGTPRPTAGPTPPPWTAPGLMSSTCVVSAESSSTPPSPWGHTTGPCLEQCAKIKKS